MLQILLSQQNRWINWFLFGQCPNYCRGTAMITCTSVPQNHKNEIHFFYWITMLERLISFHLRFFLFYFTWFEFLYHEFNWTENYVALTIEFTINRSDFFFFEKRSCRLLKNIFFSWVMSLGQMQNFERQ